MTETELHELIADCPTLYHMAEKGSWPSIAMQGLLSTTALLDLYGVPGEVRQKIEAGHRPTSVHVGNSQKRFAVIRDQIPMSDSGLQRCLPSSMAPADWYRLLNGKVFFGLRATA